MATALANQFMALGITPDSQPPAGFDPEAIAPRQMPEGLQPLFSVAVDVSGRCNMACRYCFEAATLPRREPMRAEVLPQAVRLLEANATPGIRPSIRIGSGEPLLALPLLRHLQVLLADSPVPVDVFITTNGTLIDDAAAEWLASTGWRIKISLDGPRHIHDAWRRERSGLSTYERVARAIQQLVERRSDLVSVAAVLCRGADPSEVFQSIASLGVRRIELLPVACHPSRPEEEISPTPADVIAYIEFINEYARTLVSDAPGAMPVLVRFHDCVHNVMGYGNSSVPCGAGRTSVCVGPDGMLYPCFRFVGVDRYRMGDVFKGVNEASAIFFQRGAGRETEKRLPCRTCWGASLCGGPCFAVAEFTGVGEGVAANLQCLYKLADARAAFSVVRILRQQDPEKLLSFLPIDCDQF